MIKNAIFYDAINNATLYLDNPLLFDDETGDLYLTWSHCNLLSAKNIKIDDEGRFYNVDTTYLTTEDGKIIKYWEVKRLLLRKPGKMKVQEKVTYRNKWTWRTEDSGRILICENQDGRYSVDFMLFNANWENIDLRGMSVSASHGFIGNFYNLKEKPYWWDKHINKIICNDENDLCAVLNMLNEVKWMNPKNIIFYDDFSDKLYGNIYNIIKTFIEEWHINLPNTKIEYLYSNLRIDKTGKIVKI